MWLCQYDLFLARSQSHCHKKHEMAQLQQSQSHWQPLKRKTKTKLKNVCTLKFGCRPKSCVSDPHPMLRGPKSIWRFCAHCHTGRRYTRHQRAGWGHNLQRGLASHWPIITNTEKGAVMGRIRSPHWVWSCWPGNTFYLKQWPTSLVEEDWASTRAATH